MIPCFAADKTLGRLAKWLRLLGFDTLFESERADEKFIDTLDKDRILLTRTQRIRKRYADRKLIFVKSDDLQQQLNQVVEELGLKAEQTRPFSRCLQCNVPIVAVEKNLLRGRVPDYVFETNDHFNRCPQCDRIFWPGSHTRRGLEKIRHLFDIK
jgi:hypothetical protein